MALARRGRSVHKTAVAKLETRAKGVKGSIGGWDRGIADEESKGRVAGLKCLEEPGEWGGFSPPRC